MPESFNECVKSGGKVRTEKLTPTTYRKVCYEQNGTKHVGHTEGKSV